MYYIGIDGGGTKTSFELYNEAGECVGKSRKATCHPLQVSSSEAIQILEDGVHDLTKDLASEADVFIALGLAGYGEDQALRSKIERICEKALKAYEYYLFNDVEIALEGALAGAEGILVIAGTGSIALAKQDNRYQRVGGWGYMLGDEGSAYWISKEIFKHYTMQVDGREEKSELVTLVKEGLDLKEDYDLISYFANEIENDRRAIAKHAILLEKLLELEDPAALQILEKLAKEIALLINTLGKSFDKKIKTSYLGGVFNLGAILFEKIEKELMDHIELIAPVLSPEEGAILLAKKERDCER